VDSMATPASLLIEGAPRDDRPSACLGRKVTLVRDGDESVLEAEREHDFRRTREERTDFRGGRDHLRVSSGSSRCHELNPEGSTGQGIVSRHLKCSQARSIAPFAMLLSRDHGESHRECARETGIRASDLSALSTRGAGTLSPAGFSHRRYLPEPRFEARNRFDEIRHHFVDVL